MSKQNLLNTICIIEKLGTCPAYALKNDSIFNIEYGNTILNLVGN